MKTTKWTIKAINELVGEGHEKLSLGLSGVVFIPHFIKEDKANAYFSLLENEIEWRHADVKNGKRTVKAPRLEAWYGDPIDPYKYKHILRTSLSWTPTLLEIKERVELEAAISFNSVGLRMYRDGEDNMRFHNEDDKCLGINPVTASLFFGAVRTLRLKNDIDETENIELPNGSLIIMKEQRGQEIPRTAKQITSTMQLTFRIIQYFPRKDEYQILKSV